MYCRISRKLDSIFSRCTHWLTWHWLKAGYVQNIHAVYLWVSSIIWNIYLVYRVVSYSLSNIVSVILSDYLYNVGYPISAWQTIQYCLAYAIGLAGYYQNINLMAGITGISRWKTDMHAQKLNEQMGCILLFLGWCLNNQNLKSNTWMECVLPIWYDVRIIIVMRESVARNTENIIKNSGFALTALYKLVPFQPPHIQLTALLPQFITMVSVFCLPYHSILTNFTAFCTIYAIPSRSQVRSVRSSIQGEWWMICGLEQVRWR